MGYTTDDAYVALNKQLAAMNLLRYKWLILDNLVDRVNFTDLSCLINYGKYTVYNSTKTKQNRSSVATVSSTHAGASSDEEEEFIFHIITNNMQCSYYKLI